MRSQNATSHRPRSRGTTELRALLVDPTDERYGAVTGDPLIVVDLDDGPDAVHAKLARLPCIVVGLHTRGQLPSGVDDLDVLLTRHEAPPRPWVHDDGIVLERIATNVGANPYAAVTLAQLLRVGKRLDTLDALVAESLAYSMLLAGPEFQRWLAQRPTPRPAASTAPVHVVRTDERLDITLSRPEVHNAYSAAMRDALVEALAIAFADPTVTEVALRGDGPSFCSGGDLREFGTTADPTTAHLVRTSRSPARLLAELSERVVAHVHGAGVGAGAELAAFAHHVVADPNAWFRLPEIAMGLIPGAGGTASLPRRIGRHRTAVLGLSSDRIDAPQALDWGLVDEVTD